MRVIGITGPSGAGKGLCCNCFVSNGIPWIDTDNVYHQLIDSPSACVRELSAAFGSGILDANGAVDRKALAAVVFSELDHQKLELLNHITHKYVRDETVRLLRNYETHGEKAVVVDAPLLFEAKFDELCDFCIAVIAPHHIRLKRIMVRDNLSEDRAKARLAAQKTDEYYVSRSKYTITNDSDEQNVETQISYILETEGLIG